MFDVILISGKDTRIQRTDGNSVRWNPECVRNNKEHFQRLL
jgi:hypothetical protein